MKHNPKVVSFERSAAYVHSRAMKNRRDNRFLDALELLRHAVNQEPDNTEYRLDLAEMLCEMGCHDQSTRILLDLLAGEERPDECYYGLALNLLGANELEAAKRALIIYRQKTNDDGIFTEAGNLQAEIELYENLNKPMNRRDNRAVNIAVKACDALRDEEYEKACRLFERSLSMKPDQDEMRSLYAVALKLHGDEAQALAEIDVSLARPEPDVRVLCAAAQLFQLCNKMDEAQTMAQRAIAQKPVGMELRLLLLTLGELNMNREAAEAAKAALRETPHDKTMLHMRATALHRSGVDDRQAEALWRHILRIDPEDSIADFYAEVAAEGRLDECAPDYNYQVPQAEYKRRLVWLAGQLGKGLESALALWRTDKRFRSLLRWALDTQNDSCGCAAVMVIASADDAEAESLVRQLLYRSDISMAVKLHATLFLRLRGADTNKFLPPDADPKDGLLPDAEMMLADMPVGERQLVRFADEVLSEYYGVNAKAALALMWRSYRAGNCGRELLLSTQEAAAALAWNYLLQHERRVSPQKLAKQFGCKLRRMAFYADRMSGVLGKQRGEVEHEDH